MVVLWFDFDSFVDVIGYVVRTRSCLLHEIDELLLVIVVFVVLVMFNIVNQWVVGINDILFLGLFNELLGFEVLIVVVMYCKVAFIVYLVYCLNIM